MENTLVVDPTVAGRVQALQGSIDSELEEVFQIW